MTSVGRCILVMLLRVLGIIDTRTEAKLNCQIDLELYNYTLNKVKNAKVLKEPFPHVFIEDIFQPDFYPCILNKLPDGKRRGPYKSFKSERYLVKLADRTGVQLQPGARDYREATAKALDINFWTEFTEMFANPELGRQWVETLGASTSKRYDPQGEDKKIRFVYRMDLSRDLSGYEIGPHTDTDFKWVTTLFYLPSTAKHSGVGTAILKSKSGRVQKSGTRHMPWGSDWTVHSRAPFIPNSVFAFAPCWHSWHAVPKMKEQVTRDTLQGFVQSSKRTSKFPCGR
ncbi:hypothetical protein CYMTET_24249 [Cymbomonas tetramitiformis]|uniref:Fe2OG dioxygenase domain-containing protein n=1 Tax=Cymbomonas tetramitiformis TaxID=36881 RepID=A0AAE0L050_9CHLO|nr:hypothetical protein CYMTET_24249 [Cymbomonas tetramitiformis]